MQVHMPKNCLVFFFNLHFYVATKITLLLQCPKVHADINLVFQIVGFAWKITIINLVWMTNQSANLCIWHFIYILVFKYVEQGHKCVIFKCALTTTPQNSTMQYNSWEQRLYLYMQKRYSLIYWKKQCCIIIGLRPTWSINSIRLQNNTKQVNTFVKKN